MNKLSMLVTKYIKKCNQTFYNADKSVAIKINGWGVYVPQKGWLTFDDCMVKTALGIDLKPEKFVQYPWIPKGGKKALNGLEIDLNNAKFTH